MSIQLWTLIFVVLSFGLYIGIAIWSRVSTTAGFYVAGQGVPSVFNGMATAADWMSAASFISLAGLISALGFDGAIYLLGWTGGYVLLACCSHRICANSASLRCRSLSATATPREQRGLSRPYARLSCRSFTSPDR